MQLSAETRRFWKGRPPQGLEAWFTNKAVHGSDPGGGGQRIDKYLKDPGVELGIKQRDAKPGAPPAGYEIKSLVAVSWSTLTSGPLAGRVELWTKASAKALAIEETLLVPITKVRWLRKFDTSSVAPIEISLNEREEPIDEKRRGAGLPTLGCHVELTRVTTPAADVWWTFCLEAFGHRNTFEDTLASTTALLLTRGVPPTIGGLALNYPTWLRDHV
jgi:hypothetical protein